MKKTVFYRKCILALLVLACSGSVGAQLLSERPQALGGVLLGSWEADKDPLQVYAPAEVAAAVSAQFTQLTCPLQLLCGTHAQTIGLMFAQSQPDFHLACS